MKYFMGIDIGTTGVKALIVGQDGSITKGKSVGYSLMFPNDGWVEQNPDEMWQAVLGAMENVLRVFHGNRGDILSISLSTQRDTLICVDQNNGAVYNAITWMDSRAISECNQLSADIGSDYVYSTTGVNISTIWTLAFILWIRNHNKEVYDRTACFGLVHDYIMCRLGAKEHVLDYSNACQTMLFDYKALCWDQKLMEYAGLCKTKLPMLVNSGTIIGNLAAELAQRFGLSPNIVLVAGGGDQQCAALGAGAVKNQDVEIGIGTAANLLCITNTLIEDEQQRMICHRSTSSETFVLEGAMLAVGRLIEWLKTEIFSGSSFDEINELIQNKTAPGSQGVIVLPHFEGAACPYWNPTARGAIMGLTLSTSKADIARAFIESTCFEIKKCLDVLQSFNVYPEYILISGGATHSAVWMQILADVMETRIRIPRESECAALGAAILASIGCSAFKSLEDAADALVHTDREYVPNKDNYKIYRGIYQKNIKVYDIINKNGINRLLTGGIHH